MTKAKFNKRNKNKDKYTLRECLGVYCRGKSYKQKLFKSRSTGERICPSCKQHMELTRYRNDTPESCY